MAADFLGANESYVCKCFRPGNCIGNITPNNMKSCRELNRARLRSIEGAQKNDLRDHFRARLVSVQDPSDKRKSPRVLPAAPWHVT